MPSEPEGSAFASKLHAANYPVYESAGIVWTLSRRAGSASAGPGFRVCARAGVASGECETPDGLQLGPNASKARSTPRTRTTCTSTDIRPIDGESRSRWEVARTARPSQDGRPRISTEDTAYGFRYAALRRPLVDPNSETTCVSRTSSHRLPAIIPLGDLQNVQIFVPIDDEHTYMYNVKFSFEKPPRGRARRPAAPTKPTAISAAAASVPTTGCKIAKR